MTGRPIPFLVLLAVAASGCAQEEVVTAGGDGARVVPLGEPHPLAPVAGLSGVMSDGHIEPAWGCPSPTGANPDTLDAPRAALVDVLTGGPLAAPANVAGTVTGFHLCPPCPDDVQCGPCLPNQVEVSEPVAHLGTVAARLFVGPGVTLCSLRVGERVVVTVEADSSSGDPRVIAVAGTPRHPSPSARPPAPRTRRGARP